MSPWNMMDVWGVPSVHLHAKAYEYADLLHSYGKKVVNLSFAGGLAREDQIFKALALGSPYAKTICMGRALMIPGFVGANIEGVIKPKERNRLNGNWNKMPPAVAKFGHSADEIFAGYHDMKSKLGAEEMRNIPYGAIAIWTMVDKLSAGLQQLMAGARKFSLSELSRDDLFSANRETELETGIPFMTDVLDDAAKRILAS